MSNQTHSIVKIVAYLLLASQSLLAQEYSYDVSGNLTSDVNKGISLIHYNHLDLVDTIVYTDGRKMIYTYTGTGQKLREQTILANGTVQQNDYDGHILFRNDTLRELQHNDGRVVPVNPGNSNTTFEYHYQLTDHLGNVRTVLTANPGIDSSKATLETVNVLGEQNKFLRYSNARRINATLFDHTRNGTSAYAERLNGTANEKYGLARSLSVMPGDLIRTEVYAKYVDPNSSNWQSVLPALMAQIAANTAGVVVDGANYVNSTTSFPAGFGSLQSKTDNGAPKAYLNWLVFDRNFVFQTGGFKQITTVCKESGTNVSHELVSSPDIPITREGYVYIYLSNENTTPVEVYFDDFKVTQTKGPIVQQTDYDPLGLTFNESSRENSVPNNFLYNGKELQKDNDLNWYDFGARMYDAALGRWHAVDSKSENYPDWSPYTFVVNDPLKYIDPDGNDKYEAGIDFRILNGKWSIGLRFSESEIDKGKTTSSYDLTMSVGEGASRLNLSSTYADTKTSINISGENLTFGVSNKDVKGELGLQMNWKDLDPDVKSVTLGDKDFDITMGIGRDGKKSNIEVTLKSLPVKPFTFDVIDGRLTKQDGKALTLSPDNIINLSDAFTSINSVIKRREDELNKLMEQLKRIGDLLNNHRTTSKSDK